MILIVAEKKAFAQVVAEVLNVTQTKGGYWQNNQYYVTWCYGHLVELCKPATYGSQYVKWNYESLPVIPTTFQHEVKEKPEVAKKQFSIIKKLMNQKDVSEIICATDADREGELIYRRVHYMAGCKKPVKRLWVDSMENKEVEKAFRSMKPMAEYDHIYEASHCRAISDWLIGMNGSRLFSVLYAPEKISVGRVQTPTERMVVERDLQIENFVKQTYYTVTLKCAGLDAEGERIDAIEKAKEIQALTDMQDAEIMSVERTEKNNNPPKLYSLSNLQGDANQYFAYTAQQTLDLVQKLYEKKLMTYPRTSSLYITSAMEETAQTLIPIIRKQHDYLNIAENAAFKVEQVINDKKVDSHTALIPTIGIQNPDNLKNLTKDELNILNLVSIRLLCAVDQPQRYAETVVTVESEGYRGYPFTAKGKVILEQGWKALENKYRTTFKADGEVKEKETLLPVVNQGEWYKGKSGIQDHITSPPKRFNDKTLVEAMKTAGKEFIEEDTTHVGLGTEATRASIIERLIATGMLMRKGKNIISTEKGRKVIELVPELIKSPKMTAEWEDQLYQIEKGLLDREKFMAGIIELTRTLVKENNKSTVTATFTSSNDKEIIGKCPRCGSDVHENVKYKNFSCSNRECSFALWKDNKFFKDKKKTLTKTIAKELLAHGRSKVTGLYSATKDKKYNATVEMHDSGDKYVNFKLNFDK